MWRRDQKDIEVVEHLIQSERERLIRENRHSETFVVNYMEIYEKAAKDTRNGLINLIKKDLVPEVCMQ